MKYHKVINILPEEIKKPLTHGLIYTVATGISGLLGIIVFPILARLLPVADIGKYDFFLFMLFSSVPIASLGFEYGLGAFINEITRENINAILKIVVKVVIGISLLESIALFILKILNIFQSFSMTQIILYSISLSALASTYIFKSMLVWKQHPIRASIVMRGEWLMASLFGILSVLLLGFSITNYLIGFSIAFVATIFIALRLWPFKGSPTYTISEDKIWPFVKRIIPVSLPYGITTTAWVISLGIEKAIILKELGPTQLGIYAMAHKVGLIPTMIGSSFLMGFVPELTKRKDSRSLYKPLIIFFAAYCTLSISIASLFSKEIIYLFGGSKYAYASKLLPWTTIAGLLSIIPASINPILLKRKNTTPVLITGIISSLATVILGHIFIKKYLLLGATIAVIIARIIGIGLLAIIIIKYLLKKSN